MEPTTLIRKYMSSIGKKGGSKKSDAKTKANRLNAKIRWKRHFERVKLGV
jgi:hypothetical protein